MTRSAIALACLSLLFPALGHAQQIYTCRDAQGRNTYQQTPCETGTKAHAIRAYKPVADAPQRQSQAAPARQATRAAPASGSIAAREIGSGAVITNTPGPNGADGPFVRCVGADGGVRVRQGTTCPTRTKTVGHRAGMVTDMSTGQERFMVPGGRKRNDRSDNRAKA